MMLGRWSAAARASKRLAMIKHPKSAALALRIGGRPIGKTLIFERITQKNN